MSGAATWTLRWWLASKVTIARRRSNVTYLPTFSAKWRDELVRLSETGTTYGPQAR
jgi:hypothetical protein